MKNNHWIIVYDFETDGKEPTECNPVELAAVAINPRTLEILEKDTFNRIIKPDKIGKDEYFTEDIQQTIAWHAKVRSVTSEEIVSSWKGGLSERVVWKEFNSYLKKYNVQKKKGQWYTEPARAGHNIVDFDDIIIRRLCSKYKTKFPFSASKKMDTLMLLFGWMENLDEPDKLGMDTIKDFLGLKSHGQAHSAISDVIDTAKILVKFLKFQRRQARVDKFKGVFA